MNKMVISLVIFYLWSDSSKILNDIYVKKSFLVRESYAWSKTLFLIPFEVLGKRELRL